MIKKLYKNGKKRALTFSFDDGRTQDMRVINILNKYNLKATFCISGNICPNDCFVIKDGDKRSWDSSEALRQCYGSHEVISHGLDHLDLRVLSDYECRQQITEDIKILESAFGKRILGHATPYGSYDDRVINILKSCGLIYHRTTLTKTDYEPPTDFMRWAPGPHFAKFITNDGRQYFNNFFTTDTPLALFCIWGHSYELNILDCYSQKEWLGLTDRWTYFEKLCQTAANRHDVWYATNIEIFEYLSAMYKAEIEENHIKNPTDTDLFFEINGKPVTVLAKTRYDF